MCDGKNFLQGIKDSQQGVGALSARTLFEELQSQREIAIIPHPVETFGDFIGTLGAYKDFFALDETTQFYYLAEEPTRVPHGTSGIPGIYSNGRSSLRVG